MATYFHPNTDIQAPDGLQTLVLMNPGYVQYSTDAQPSGGGAGNFVFLNSAAGHTSHLAHMPQQTQQFVGIPLTASQDDHQQNAVHEISPLHGMIPSRVQYNLWNPVEQSVVAARGETTPRGSNSQQGGLSLTLSSSQHPPGFRSFRSEREHPQPAPSARGVGSPSSASGVTNNGGGVLGVQGVLLSSKYLKAAQEILDEVVNVGGGIDKPDILKKASNNNGQASKAAGESSSSAAGKDDGGGGKGGAAPELSTAERQEIQMKKAKLINMLDEAEQRYRQYHHHMQIVISSFEQATGTGSARTYTALALQTISKQFRCLKDAIGGQIKAANKSLGEDDGSGGVKIEGSSRLKFVDHQIRQQRALQQLGMIQHNAWRPQRGLPERSVSILRAWLFEHFLHPYPKDSDKHLLAKQTGLTRSQVSNWFINARVRLWKPMVEEMYAEEMKEHEQNGTGENARSKSIDGGDDDDDDDDDSASKSSSPHDKKGIGGPFSENISSRSFKSKETNNNSMTGHDGISTNSASSIGRAPPGFALMGSSSEIAQQASLKKPRSIENMLHSHDNNGIPSSLEDQMTLKFGGDERSQDGYSIMAGGGPANFIGGFGQYPIPEIGRFGSEQFVPSPGFRSNGVSLTLGLPHADNLSLSIDHHHQAFLPSQSIHMGRRVDVVSEGNGFGAIDGPIPPPHSSAAAYESMNIQNRKRFAAQLLPDFVA